MDRVYAQQARAILDKMVGYTIPPSSGNSSDKV